jgi:hypothetical protein
MAIQRVDADPQMATRGIESGNSLPLDNPARLYPAHHVKLHFICRSHRETRQEISLRSTPSFPVSPNGVFLTFRNATAVFGS